MYSISERYYDVLAGRGRDLLRYVAYSDTDKMYRFRISKENEKLFSAIAEFYLLSQLNRSFSTLDYYKNIVIET